MDPGPSRGWYLLGFGLWVAAWVGFTATAYATIQVDPEVAAAHQRIANGETAEVVVDHSGRTAFYAEVAADRSDGEDAAEDISELVDRVSIRVTDPRGSTVRLSDEDGFRYSISVDGDDVDGFNLALGDLPEGTYEVGVLTDVPDFAGLAVGEAPEVTSAGRAAMWALAAPVGIVVLWWVNRRRRRAHTSIAGEG